MGKYARRLDKVWIWKEYGSSRYLYVFYWGFNLWGCSTYKIAEDPYKVINNFVEAEEKGEDYGINCSKLGDFCADAGLVSVFLLDEVRKYNPSIDKWIEEHDWCVTKISDFDGEVNYYVDKVGNAHIVGIGNINFFTVQTNY